MRKWIIILFLALVAAPTRGYCFETSLLDMHKEVLEESKKIKGLLKDTKDVLLVNSMWDAALITMTQIEAYFSMMGVFNTIDPKEITPEPIRYLRLWLGKIKDTNQLNIKSLNALGEPKDKNTELHMAVLKVYYRKLNDRIDRELEKLNLIEESLEMDMATQQE